MKYGKILMVIIIGCLLFSSVSVYGAEPYLELPMETDEWITWNDIDDGPLSNENAYLYGEETEKGLVVLKKAGVSDEESVRGVYQDADFDIELDISKGLYLYYDFIAEAEEFAFAFYVGSVEIKLIKTEENSDFSEGEKADSYQGKVDLVQLMKDKKVDVSSNKVTIKNITMYVNGPSGNSVTLKRLGFGDASRENLQQETPAPITTAPSVTEKTTPTVTPEKSTNGPTEPAKTVKPFVPKTNAPTEQVAEQPDNTQPIGLYIVIAVVSLVIIEIIIIVVVKRLKK